jgi:hypothetical protein
LTPIALEEKTFPPALAFAANHFAALSNDIPFSVADRTNHLTLQDGKRLKNKPCVREFSPELE